MDPQALARRLAAQPWVLDTALAAALTLLAQVQVGAVSAVDRLLLLVVTGVVVVRRRAPLATSLVVAAGVALMALTPDQPSVFGEYLALMLAAYTAAERCRLRLAILGGLAMVAGVVVHDLASVDYDSAGAIAGDLVVPVLIWGVGRIVHVQYRRVDRSEELVAELEQDRAQLARLAVAAERAHLARELHDVVTHSVSVVVIQAQGAQRVLDEGQPEVRKSLADIESAGRLALTEMRRLLDVLPQDERERPPAPGLADVPALVARVRAAGLSIQLIEIGDPAPLSGSVELSLYRVVQEALTNTLKYAPMSQVRVEVEHRPDSVRLSVVDDGQGEPSGTGGGRGLVGMRDRVTMLGGTLEAGRTTAGGFRVCAELPARATVR